MADKGDIEKVFREEIIEDIRPWGKFRAYPYRLGKSLKLITVMPGQSLSLQYHRNRAEFWVVLDAGLEVTLGKKIWEPEPHDEIFIPREAPHRLRCVGRVPARLMEIWIGDSDESDIVRVKDEYGR